MADMSLFKGGRRLFVELLMLLFDGHVKADNGGLGKSSIQFNEGTYSGRGHVLGRWQVGEWRGWAGGHATGLGLRPAVGAGTARHTTGWEEDGERRWGQSAHGVAWVRAIGGVVVARDGVGDVMWVAGGQMERAGARSVCG